MARNNIIVRKSYGVRIAQANDNRDGDGATLMVQASWVIVAAPVNSSRLTYEYHGGVEIDRIRIQPLGTVIAECAVRFFLDQPGRGRFLLHEHRIPKDTKPAFPLRHDQEPPYGAMDLRESEMNGPWYLKPGDGLYASCSTDESFDLVAFGGEYTDIG